MRRRLSDCLRQSRETERSSAGIATGVPNPRRLPGAAAVKQGANRRLGPSAFARTCVQTGLVGRLRRRGQLAKLRLKPPSDAPGGDGESSLLGGRSRPQLRQLLKPNGRKTCFIGCDMGFRRCLVRSVRNRHLGAGPGVSMTRSRRSF